MNGPRNSQGVLVLSLLAVGLALVLLTNGRADPPVKGDAAKASDKPAVKPSTERTLRLPEVPYHYADIDLPAHFKTAAARRFDNTPRDNPITDNGATLGRVLFYDTRLSANNTVACATCHLQSRAFSEPAQFSKGYEGKFTDRNAMPLVNLRYYPRGRFFWDERARTLEDQVLMPMQSKTEMGQDLKTIVAIVSKDAQYQELFRKAFGDPEVTSPRIARAIAQFLRSMVSYQSKYDEGLAKVRSSDDNFPNFTSQENRGKTLFMNNCATCHLPGDQEAHFIMNRPLNNGLDGDIKNKDGGVGDINLKTTDVGLFKSPSLRNVELTAPYMHDGRLANLEAVIDHYTREVKNHPNLDGRARRRNLSANDKTALVAFLKTLTDQKFITDPKFSDPFQ
jgi:cytochrome c peroxidase